MEECPPVQTMSVARAYASLMGQSSILLEMCGNSEIIPLAQENPAPPFQCLEPVDVLEYQVVDEPEHGREPQQSEEIVWAVEDPGQQQQQLQQYEGIILAVDDPELIRLAEECSLGNTWIEETSA